MRSLKYLIIISFVEIIALSGCATYDYSRLRPTSALPGVYHRVERAQTLFGISKMYNVDIDELIKANRIFDASRIEFGQLIFIPRAQKKPSASIKYSGDEFIWPVKGRVIAAFGSTVNNMVNKGINISAPIDTEVVSSRNGKVVFYNSDFLAFGKTVIIDHQDGFLTVYGRNSKVFVKLGDYVSKGTVIAAVGSSGRDKSPYLHFEIRKGHIPQNPYYYLSQ